MNNSGPGYKPYTLKWWLNLLQRATVIYTDADTLRLMGVIKRNESSKYMKQFKRYAKLADYITERIIKKYGESK